MSRSPSLKRPARLGLRYVVSYLGLYAATLAFLVRYRHFPVIEPLLMLGLVGGGFTFIAWLLTRRARPVAAAQPRRAVLGYLLVVAVFSTWGLGALTPRQPLHEILAMVTKLAVFVAVPWLLFDRARLPLRFNRRDLLTTLVMSAVLLLFQFFFGRGPREIADAHFAPVRLAVALVFAFLWLSLEAGLVEEYFFRRLLQTVLESLTRSSAGGIVLASLLFALAHAPGLYLRTSQTGENLGSSPSLLFALGYAIVMLSPTGLFLGVLWSRTRNLAIVVAVHGLGDLLPNVVDLARKFF